MRTCLLHGSEYSNVTCNALNTSTPSQISLSSLETIRDSSDNSLTLQHILKTKDDEHLGDQVHNMVCMNSSKVYEVKTKYLPKIWPRGYKIAVVKDQTVYEQLIRESMLKKYQRMLLSSISHEIRNPLNAIGGYSNMISEIVKNHSISSLCRKIEYAVQQVDFILSGAFDLMVGENSISIQRAQNFNIKTAVQHVVDMVVPSLEKKPVVLNMEVERKVPEMVYSDCKKYEMILFNLLMNAVKYTHYGKIVVKVGYDQGRIETSVEDTGVGIKEENIEKLFELYSNIERVNPYNPQGMGLGLALCKKLTEILGGDISAISKLGIGSTFTFTIQDNYFENNRFVTGEDPIPSEERLTHTIKRFVSHPLPEHCKYADVLIVDDEATNRLVLKSYLAVLGFTSEEVENGKMAIECIKKRLTQNWYSGYKLILMDINMPEMDGTTATQELIRMYKHFRVRQTPIVAVTAANLQTRTDVQDLFSVGFAEISILCSIYQIIVQKPVTKAYFVEKIKKYLQRLAKVLLQQYLMFHQLINPADFAKHFKEMNVEAQQLIFNLKQRNVLYQLLTKCYQKDYLQQNLYQTSAGGAVGCSCDMFGVLVAVGLLPSFSLFSLSP
eukprot:TRINITY_DN2927_c0_g1_i1.p1 TRINITY_DN2927_c0_g1~~TRINITY_DN2927_c0_g1_i1.p1  ORF type:complete len:611 (+),score=54.38 TRINITY_DN2927_c0_g1_i1:984-2816(+)